MKNCAPALPLFFLLWMCVCACSDPKPGPQPAIPPAVAKKKLQKANKMLVHNENYEIENYISRRKWDMVATGSGLRYRITHAGSGDSVSTGRRVTYRYSITLLNGAECYNSDRDGVKSFVAGKDDVESGLQEAMLHFREGDHAILVLPSHLAFGLTGDDHKIPPRAALVYRVEVVSVE